MGVKKGGHCWNCGVDLGPLDYGRQDTCKKCGKDTRVCRNCIHFDPAAHNLCHEPQADRVVEKERANFCDYFVPQAGIGGGEKNRDSMKSTADALFRKK